MKKMVLNLRTIEDFFTLQKFTNLSIVFLVYLLTTLCFVILKIGLILTNVSYLINILKMLAFFLIIHLLLSIIFLTINNKHWFRRFPGLYEVINRANSDFKNKRDEVKCFSDNFVDLLKNKKKCFTYDSLIIQIVLYMFLILIIGNLLVEGQNNGKQNLFIIGLVLYLFLRMFFVYSILNKLSLNSFCRRSLYVNVSPWLIIDVILFALLLVTEFSNNWSLPDKDAFSFLPLSKLTYILLIGLFFVAFKSSKYSLDVRENITMQEVLKFVIMLMVAFFIYASFMMGNIMHTSKNGLSEDLILFIFSQFVLLYGIIISYLILVFKVLKIYEMKDSKDKYLVKDYGYYAGLRNYIFKEPIVFSFFYEKVFSYYIVEKLEGKVDDENRLTLIEPPNTSCILYNHINPIRVGDKLEFFGYVRKAEHISANQKIKLNYVIPLLIRKKESSVISNVT